MASTLISEPRIPVEIVDAAKSGSLVLFIGAGISRMVGQPSWDGFANSVIDQLVEREVIDHHVKALINQLPDPRKRLSIAKILDDENGSKIDYEKIFRLKDESSDIYQCINQFGCTFVTTNYDKLIVPDGNDKPENEWRFFRREELFRAKLDVENTVIHLHGCIDDPKSMVVTTKDYLEHYSSQEVPSFLEHLFSNKTVLFLGYVWRRQKYLNMF